MKKSSEPLLLISLFIPYCLSALLLIYLRENFTLVIANFIIYSNYLIVNIRKFLKDSELSYPNKYSEIDVKIIAVVLGFYVLEILILFLVSIRISNIWLKFLCYALVIAFFISSVFRFIKKEINFYTEHNRIEYKLFCLKNLILENFKTGITKKELEEQIKYNIGKRKNSLKNSQQELEYQCCYEIFLCLILESKKDVDEIYQAIQNKENNIKALVNYLTFQYDLTHELSEDLKQFIQMPYVSHIVLSLLKV